MLIVALVLALIGLVALVFAVVTSNELVAWVCIGASVLGVVLLIVDAMRERRRRDVVDAPEELAGDETADEPSGVGGADLDAEDDTAIDYPDDAAADDPDVETGQAADDTATGPTEDAADEATEESAVSADPRGEDTTA
ncbi:hypothetical protein [Mycobacterium spongiae]|uniref:Transmembrane protein n=1 Tax=Mycobacterium spongiae TaxID=886343 RepID=A0A975JYC6_9MYCO|nr:hypothetical protein [Mycobacterium spongiae]QUR67959.1 hypothetical protein F6B93_13385 [Mycobacterium spongiae]